MERYLRNERSLARVGIVYSQQTGTAYGGDRANQKSRMTGSAGTRRWSKLGSPFEMVHDGLLAPDTSASSGL